MCRRDQAPYPLPEDPALAAVATALSETGQWGWLVDRRWRLAYVTQELRLTFGGNVEFASFPIGAHAFGPEWFAASTSWRFGPTREDLTDSLFRTLGGWLLNDTPGGRSEVRELVDPSLWSLVDELEPSDTAALAGSIEAVSFAETTVEIQFVATRVRDHSGGLAGTMMILKPAADMAVLGAMASMADLGHLERMLSVAEAGQRPAAILFADLEASTPLSKRLSTADYFSLSRRLVRAADAAVIEAGGLVGRHVGDGVVAFFLAQTTGSESAAASACIGAARTLREATAGVAERCDLSPDEVALRFGLHWGTAPYVGSITTGGRGEVTALGNEVNEAARIEACATGGRILASKGLIERLESEHASALDLEPDRLDYTALADPTTATAKARRDAPSIEVCDLAPGAHL